MSDPLQTEADDEQLMAALAGGNRAALTALVHRHQDRVLSLAFRYLGRWDLAEDVAQEAFLRLMRAAGRWRPRAKLTTWLYRVVINLCHDTRRRQRRRPAALEAAEAVADPRSTRDMADERADRAAAVRAAVDALPDRQRLAILLHRYEGLSHEQVAEATGWSVSAVESLLVRAYDKLRRSLRRRQNP